MLKATLTHSPELFNESTLLHNYIGNPHHDYHFISLIVTLKKNHDHRSDRGLEKKVCLDLFGKGPHIVNHVPDILIGNLSVVSGHLSPSVFGFVEMLPIGLFLVEIT